VEITVVRAQPEIFTMLKEIVQKNWLLIIMIAIIVYFIWKSKNKKKEVNLTWAF